MFPQTVIEAVYVSKLYWWLQPTAAGLSGRFSEMHRVVRTLHNAHVAQQCLHCKWFRWSSAHLTLQIWIPSADIMSGERYTKLFWKLHLKLSTVSELKVALEKTWDNFPQNKVVPRFRKRLREYVKAGEKHFWAVAVTQKCVHTYGICACLECY